MPISNKKLIGKTYNYLFEASSVAPSSPSTGQFAGKIPANKERLTGGKSDDTPDSSFDPIQLHDGIEHEMEHTSDSGLAKEIAKDHLIEDPHYYIKLKKMMSESTEKFDPRKYSIAKAMNLTYKGWGIWGDTFGNAYSWENGSFVKMHKDSSPELVKHFENLGYVVKHSGDQISISKHGSDVYKKEIEGVLPDKFKKHSIQTHHETSVGKDGSGFNSVILKIG